MAHEGKRERGVLSATCFPPREAPQGETAPLGADESGTPGREARA